MSKSDRVVIDNKVLIISPWMNRDGSYMASIVDSDSVIARIERERVEREKNKCPCCNKSLDT